MLPRDRNKTLTCLAGTEPVVGAQRAAVQRLQFFLSESAWDSEQVNAGRLELLLADPAAAPHGNGVLVVDDSEDREAGTATAHVGKQYLGSVGKIDRGVVTATTCWAYERVYYPVYACPYTPARHFSKGKSAPGSAASCRSLPAWPPRQRRPGWSSARWPPTAPTATTTASGATCTSPGCRS
ncbi:transposase [Streptomyces sp. BPTC-684]|uniref:transposase n=1 Tax=Streptomyces sp. BPTC-684 TaxID=3043734 RepID=UPI0024B0C0E6|nr:transposase [Streptomyces sp. BPTC-684]WHM41531.1 transposase [Streptomyces sp. BPTC-684]